MKYTTILVLFFSMCFKQASAQHAYEIQHSQGAIFLEQFGKSSQYDIRYKGYTMQSDITLWKSYNIDRKFSPRVGIGYTHFWYLGVRVPRETVSYIPLRLGVDYNTGYKSLVLYSHLSNYFLISPTLRNYPFAQERRLYANIDLGVRFKTGKKWTFNISSPVTVLPMFYRRGIRRLTPPGERYNLWVENVGINVGFKYRFMKD